MSHVVYLDESRDVSRDIYILSALVVPIKTWHQSFQQLKDWRRAINTSDGVFVRKELHAWEFTSGRGRVARHVVTKFRRCQLFNEGLAQVAAFAQRQTAERRV